MNINNNFTPLAWHQGDIELQSNRASYAYGHIVPLFASATKFVPFQIVTEVGYIDVANLTLKLKNVDGTDALSGANLRSRFGLVKKQVELRPQEIIDGTTIPAVNVDVIIYNGGQMDALPIGQYYLELTSGQRTWYSDVVTIVADVTKMTKVTWWDAADLLFGAGCIVYKYGTGNATQYKNVMYFMEEIGMPEYTQEEEGETRDGLFYASKLISGKKYKMQVAQASEAMCDAMRFIHLADWVEIWDGYQRHYLCDSVLVTPEWQTGAVASVAVEITTDTFVKSVGKGYITERQMTGIIGEAVIGVDFEIGA
jgi:hypothetical protein